MGIVARTILQCKHKHTGTVFLRLCKESYHAVTVARTPAVNVCRQFPEKYIPLNRYKTAAVITGHIIEASDASNHVPEHKLMHSLLQNSSYYNNSIIPPIKTSASIRPEEIARLYNTHWEDESVENIFNTIKKLTYCYLSGSRFEISLYESVLQAMMPKLSELPNERIKVLIQCLIALKDTTSKTVIYNRFLKELNKQCQERFFSADTKELLLFCDAFYQLKYDDSEYFWRALRKLGGKPQKLSAKDLVQFMFYLNLANLGSAVNMFEIEYRFEECIHELSGNEIGIIARGFFLQRRGIRNKTLLPIIMSKVTKFIDKMDSTALASTMKIIRYSDCVHCLHSFQKFLVSLYPVLPRLSLKCLTHISHAFGALRVYDETLTKGILERTKNEVKQARIKDIERIVYAICTVTPFTSYYNDVCHFLLNEVLLTYKTNRSAEINRFPLSFTRILTFLTVKDIYIPELIEHAFDPAFIQKTYKSNIKFLTNELLMLHCSVQIELPSYKGPLLRDHVYQYLIKKYSSNDDIHRKDNNLKLKTEIVHIAKQILGVNVCVDYILPHYSTRDIAFGLDEHNNAVDVEPILAALPNGYIKNVKGEEFKNIQWKVLFILPSTARVLGHTGYSGTVYRKFRQLKAIGFTPIPICENQWIGCTGAGEKENYLRQLIYESTEYQL